MRHRLSTARLYFRSRISVYVLWLTVLARILLRKIIERHRHVVLDDYVALHSVSAHSSPQLRRNEPARSSSPWLSARLSTCEANSRCTLALPYWYIGGWVRYKVWCRCRRMALSRQRKWQEPLAHGLACIDACRASTCAGATPPNPPAAVNTGHGLLQRHTEPKDSSWQSTRHRSTGKGKR
jgi:hypothetical protein